MFQVINGALVGILLFGVLAGLIAFNVNVYVGGDAGSQSIITMLRWVCVFIGGGAGGVMGAVIGATAANPNTKPMSTSEKVLAGVEVGLLVLILVFAAFMLFVKNPW